MVINWQKLNTKAKVLVVAAVSAAGSMQIPWVKDNVMPHLANHPKIASLVTSLIFIAGVIQNPTTQKILHQLGFEEEQAQPDGSVKKTSGVITETTEAPPPTQL
ncbi:MAG TPA: hypothetical protein VGU67_02990 [Edaphobacter sp.]|nr:hypothetical protein [Edaphobacter sp.]